ncbi:MAG: alpha/beta hydrolase [Proteobacteria bacterium]|nr:alpha/beta hydrolase [Pseudomonadota bacterium]
MTTTSQTVVYRGYTASELGRQYDIEATVPNVAEWLQQYAEVSARTRSRRRALLDVVYGDGPGETLDLYFADRGDHAPIVLFIHGGGWRASNKESRAFLADFYCPAGAVYISLEYPLAPAHTLDQMADAVLKGITWAKAEAPTFGGDPSRIVVVGNSAGGHLAAVAATRLAPSELAGVVTVSGVFDMTPLRLTNANSWLQMNDAAAERHSPIRHIARDSCPLFAFVGQHEPAEFRRQSRDFAAAWQEKGGQAEFLEVAGHNHFSIIGLIRKPGNPISDAILRSTGAGR